jgi:hypothetical protein
MKENYSILNKETILQQIEIEDDEQFNIMAVDSTCSRRKQTTLVLIDHVLNLFLFTPLVIGYWTSTWDLIDLYLFPNNRLASYSASFLWANGIILVAYFLQEKLQQLHNGSVIGHEESVNVLKPARYYDRRIWLRAAYTYLLTIAYVMQWRTYWNMYNYLTQDVSFVYFFIISICTLVFYRYLLKNSLSNFVKTSPYQLAPDCQFGSYFLQSKIINLSDVNNLFCIVLFRSSMY